MKELDEKKVGKVKNRREEMQRREIMRKVKENKRKK